MKAGRGDRIVYGGRSGRVVSTSKYRFGEPPFYVQFDDGGPVTCVIPGIDTVIETVNLADVPAGRWYPRRSVAGEPSPRRAPESVQ